MINVLIALKTINIQICCSYAPYLKRVTLLCIKYNGKIFISTIIAA